MMLHFHWPIYPHEHGIWVKERLHQPFNGKVPRGAADEWDEAEIEWTAADEYETYYEDDWRESYGRG